MEKTIKIGSYVLAVVGGIIAGRVSKRTAMKGKKKKDTRSKWERTKSLFTFRKADSADAKTETAEEPTKKKKKGSKSSGE